MKRIELIHEPKVGEELIKLLKKRIERLEKANTHLKAQLTIHSASESFNCIASNGYDGFMNKCEEQCDMCKSGFNLKD